MCRDGGQQKTALILKSGFLDAEDVLEALGFLAVPVIGHNGAECVLIVFDCGDYEGEDGEGEAGDCDRVHCGWAGGTEEVLGDVHGMILDLWVWKFVPTSFWWYIYPYEEIVGV